VARNWLDLAIAMYVHEYMMPNPVTITSADTLADAWALMRTKKLRRLPVVDDDVLVGILSEYDLRGAKTQRLECVAVRTAMTPEPFIVSPNDTLEHAVSITRQRRIGALPVVDHGRLVGIITAKDLWIAEPRPLPEWDQPHPHPVLLRNIR
jgi:acetoin utilization protein AcuB